MVLFLILLMTISNFLKRNADVVVWIIPCFVMFMPRS